jgi:hypothetical protein
MNSERADVPDPSKYVSGYKNTNVFLTCVQEQVVLEIGVFAETPVADMALEGPGPIVDVHMRFEVSWCRERLGAQTTLMGLFLQQRHVEPILIIFF